MAVTASFIETPPVVSLQGNPCLFTAITSLTGVTDIYMHLVIQELVDGVWTDTDKEDAIPLVSGAAQFDLSGYFADKFSCEFMFPEHSSNLVLERAGMINNFRVRLWESYVDGSGDAQDKSGESFDNNEDYYMLPGGISDDDYAALNENSSNWWDEHVDSARALNWIPGTKKVSPSSIEKIYWIQATAGAGTLRFSYIDTDGLPGTHNFAFTFSAYAVYEFSVSPALLDELTGKEIASYTVSLVGTNFAQAFTVDRENYEWNEYFLIANQFGAMEGLWCRGARTEKYSYKRDIYERTDRRNIAAFDRLLGNLRGNLQRNNESNTGFMSDNFRYWAAELLNTDDAFRIVDDKIWPIVINADSIDVLDQTADGEPAALTFTWNYSRIGRFTSRMGIRIGYIYPPYFSKLEAFFYKLTGATLLDKIAGLEATISGTDITFPDITGNDLFDFSDATYWDQTLIAATGWYSAGSPRTCPLNWLVGVTWAEAATATTHARLFHRDYDTRVRDMIPVLVYASSLEPSEQEAVVDWLDWYATIWQDGAILTQDGTPLTQ